MLRIAAITLALLIAAAALVYFLPIPKDGPCEQFHADPFYPNGRDCR